jgi:hypothetical protein
MTHPVNAAMGAINTALTLLGLLMSKPSQGLFVSIVLFFFIVIN